MTIRPATPSTLLSTAVVAAVAGGWLILRLVIFHQTFLPLTFVLPLMLCVWTRRSWQLWAMAALFVGSASLKYFWMLPEGGPMARTGFLTDYVATLVNIFVGGGIIQLILILRRNLDARMEQILEQNEELQTQSEELAQQNEEIRAQSEELAQQNEEIEAQAEELARQNEELHDANQRLVNREEVLQATVECSRSAGGGKSALEEVSRRARNIIGAPADLLAVVELEDDRLVVRAQTAVASAPSLSETLAFEDSLAKLVLTQDKTAYVDDLRERKDMAASLGNGAGYRSALATPLRVAGRSAGALIACSRSPAHWEQDQFRLLEWASAQCGLIIESMRWQEALQQRAEAIEAANRAKDDFLATLSHELRTPLTPVLAAASAWEDDDRLPEEVRADLGMMKRNVSVQSRLIDDLLDVTRIARGKVDLHLQPVNMRELLRETAAIVAHEAEAKRQKLELELSLPDDCLVMGESARLQQVFWNLLNNAVKFSPVEGTVIMHASVQSGEHAPVGTSAAPRLVVRIVDTGPGIEPDDMFRIFLPFEQVAVARKRGSRAGLGLGLSIAKALTELHDGTISVESAGAGLGAAFVVSLPMAVEGAPAEGNGSGNDHGRDTAPGVSSTLRILLVEDHLDTAQVLGRVLERSGHKITHARGVAEGLACWKRDTFDLIVSDLGLGDGSGLDLMRQIRVLNPKVPAVCMSGYGMESDIETSRAAGFHEHLIKPVDVRKLRDAVNRLRSPDSRA